MKAAKVVPDFQCSNQNFITITRETDQARIYFLMNKAEDESYGIASFRVKDKTPEFWDPMNGNITPAPFWRVTDDARTELPVKLAPNASIFVVFTKKAATDYPMAIVQGKVMPDNKNSLIIYEAKYRIRGDADGGTDVLARVKKAIGEKGLTIDVENNILCRTDPYRDKFKELMLRYQINGKEKTSIYPEHSHIYLPLVPEGSFIARLTGNDQAPSAEFTKPGTFAVQYKSGVILSAVCEKKMKTVSLNNNWKVEFAKDLGAPKGEINFDRLISWTDRPEFGIKYFSGSAVYRKTISIEDSELNGRTNFVLDLGEVKNLARVIVNGKDFGVLWTPPFTCDITSALKSGKNLLEIKTVNLWVNRMIGDEFHPTASQTEKPDWVVKGLPNSGDGRYTWASWKGWTKDDKPLASGLLGPVSLEARPVLPLKAR